MQNQEDKIFELERQIAENKGGLEASFVMDKSMDGRRKSFLGANESFQEGLMDKINDYEAQVQDLQR